MIGDWVFEKKETSQNNLAIDIKDQPVGKNACK
jgi:hypothetical protein